MQLTLTAAQLSDLFFNHEKPLLDKAYGMKAETDEEAQERQQAIKDALQQEAENFSALLGHQVDTDWIINDYNRRV